MKNENECEVKQLMIRVDPELKTKFNIKCIQNHTSMNQVLNECIYNYVKNN